MRTPTHPQISEEDFGLSRLHCSSYTQEELCNSIVRYCQRVTDANGDLSKLAERQRNAAKRCQIVRTFNLGNPECPRHLKKAFDLFNDAFFNGLLTGFCTLEITPWTCKSRLRGSDWRCHEYYPGHEKDPRFCIEKPYCHIEILAAAPDSKTSYEKLLQYHTGLLHSMLQAFFFIYRSVCDNCPRSLSGGYVLAWQKSAKAIENANKNGSILLGMGIKLEREFSLAFDMQRGYSMPNTQVLRSLSLDVALIWKTLHTVREERVKNFKQQITKCYAMRAAICTREWGVINGW